MSGKGLSRERITDAAIGLIEREGLAAFSLRNLAAALEIQVSSLYNHIQGQTDLLTEIGLRAVDMLTEREEQAIRGKHRDEALFALADAYRAFAAEHTELYRIIMGVHTLELSVPDEAFGRLSGPIFRVIGEYGVKENERIHYQRVLRSVMHGFFAHENSGGFAHRDVDRERSYKMAIGCVADALARSGEEYHAE